MRIKNSPPHRLSRISRRDFFGLAAGFPTLAAVGAGATAPKPNVIVILVDDMGFSDIGCYGGEIPTPNIDSLARNGVRFTQMYNTARCSPSRASLLTGLYPHQAGMGHLEYLVLPNSRGTQGRLTDECATIAEVVRPAGYFTAMAGKWHLGQTRGTPPSERGFDRSLSSPTGGVYYPGQHDRDNEKLFLNGQGFPLNDPKFGGDSWYSTDLWTEFSLRFIDEARQEKKPFFLYLANNAPHFPLMAPQEDIARFRGKFMQGWDRLREARYERQLASGLIDARWKLSPRPPDVPAWDSLSAAEKDRYDHMMAVYAACLAAVDRNVGILVDGLKQRGILDNTLILFLSDNGGNAESGPAGIYKGDHPGDRQSTVWIGMDWATLNNTPFRRYKHFTHEGGISTPLIAHWPAAIPKERNGKFERQPCHLIDLMPTVMQVSGAPYPKTLHGKTPLPVEGVSIVPAFSGQALHRKNPIFFMHEGNRAVRDQKWKLVSKYTEPWELYDMDADRSELHDMAAKHPEVVRQLSAKYDEWARRTYAEPWTGPPRTDWGAEKPVGKQ